MGGRFVCRLAQDPGGPPKVRAEGFIARPPLTTPKRCFNWQNYQSKCPSRAAKLLLVYRIRFAYAQTRSQQVEPIPQACPLPFQRLRRRRAYELNGLVRLDLEHHKRKVPTDETLQREICALASMHRHTRICSAGSTGEHTDAGRSAGYLSQEARILPVCGSPLSRARVLGRHAFAHVVFHGRRSFRLPSRLPRTRIVLRKGRKSRLPAASVFDSRARSTSWWLRIILTVSVSSPCSSKAIRRSWRIRRVAAGTR